MTNRPTTRADKPLAGLTVLIVATAIEASPIATLCLASGARVRRADDARKMLRHLAGFTPSLVICAEALRSKSNRPWLPLQTYGADFADKVLTAIDDQDRRDREQAEMYADLWGLA